MYRKSGMRIRNGISVLLVLILAMSGWLPCLTGLSSARADVDTNASVAYNATVYITGVGEYLNVRNVPGTSDSYVIDQIFRGQRVCINSYMTVPGDPSGYDSWCEIIYNNRGQTFKGYVVTKNLVPDVTCSESFEKSIAGFPESYKPYLRLLHSKFPNWKFQPVQTTADWDTIMKVQTEWGTSAIPEWVPDTWKSHEPGAYDPKTGKYAHVDSGGWVNAAYDVVAYYMDPRNMLFDSQCFQFLDLGYDPDIQTKEAVDSIITGTFMKDWDVYREPTPTPAPIPQDTPEPTATPTPAPTATPTPEPIYTVPTEPVEPSDPSDPSDSSDPSDPADPSENGSKLGDRFRDSDGASIPSEGQLLPMPGDGLLPPPEDSEPVPSDTEAPDPSETAAPTETPVPTPTAEPTAAPTPVPTVPAQEATPTPTPDPEETTEPLPTSRPMIPTPTGTPTPDPLIPVSHLDALMEAAQISGISPVYLASKIIQEVGAEGSDSIYGTGHNGLFPGYYNYYNIGAYAADGYDAMGRGLWYASCSDGENEQYMRPWNAGYKAIVGGAIWQELNYYKVGQNSLFLMKFNVTPDDESKVGRHQYMTNIRALENESYKMYKGYKSINMLQEEFLFKIPVFEGMPAEAAQLPPTIGPAQYIRDIYKSVLGTKVAESSVRSWANKITDNNVEAFNLAYQLVYNPRVLFKKYNDEEYIAFVYKALLDKEASNATIKSYLKKFEKGMTRSEFVEELLNSSLFNLRLKKYGIVKKTFRRSEAQKHYDNDALFIDRLYSTALGRETDYGGFEFWVQKVRKEGTSYSALVEFFVLSDEAKQTYKKNSEYINMLYKAIYDREADEGGYEYWSAYMYFGMNREEVLEGFLGGQEFENLCKRYGGTKGSYHAKNASGVDKHLNVVGVSDFVKRMYTVVLDRDYELGGYKFWGNKICTHELGGADMAREFVFSEEYIEKNTTNKEFLTMLYKAILGRDPEDDGLKFWMKRMKSGYSRQIILEEFIESEEYANICASYGIEK